MTVPRDTCRDCGLPVLWNDGRWWHADIDHRAVPARIESRWDDMGNYYEVTG